MGRAAGDQDQRQDRQRVGHHQEDLIGHDAAGELLQAHLIGVEGSEEDGADERLAGTPRAEDDQRDADPAAAVDHLEEERVEGRHGEEGAADRHQRAAGDDCAHADCGDADALSLHRRRVLAGGADREAERRAVEHPGGQRDGEEGEIGERRSG